jgi:hypothetical protein
MTTPPPSGEVHDVPSGRRLLTTTVVAAAVAALIVTATVLPAEYGIDPLGTGRLLGLTAISAPPESVETPSVARGAFVQDGPVVHAGSEFMTDSRVLVLEPYQTVEYKYRLDQGAMMIYSWSASAPAIVDFHGESDGLLPAGGSSAPAPGSYEKATKQQASGAFTSPFDGIHGWYWENPTGAPLTVTLTSAGFYTEALELRSPRDRRSHPLSRPGESILPRPAQGPAAP